MNINNNDYSERRQCKRFRIKYPASLFLDNKSFSVSTFNVAEGGVGVELNKKLKINDSIQHKIQIISDNYKQNIDTKVVWCKHIGDGKYRAGLEIMT